MAQTLITIVQGNKNYDLVFNVTDGQNVIINLTGASPIIFKAQHVSDPTVQYSEAMSIVDAPNGKCKFTVQATDFLVPGNYNCQIEINFPSVSEKITIPNILVVVLPAVPV